MTSPRTTFSSKRAAFYMGAFFLLVCIVLAVLIPCPENTSFFVFQTALSIAAAGLATVLTGFLNVQYVRGVQAGGGLAVFLIVFFAQPITGTCPKSFSYTIRVDENPDTPVSDDYPKPNGASVELWSGTQWLKGQLSDDGLADFKEISITLRDSMTKLRLGTPYWKLTSDTVWLVGNSSVVHVEPNGSLGRISGQVTKDGGLGVPHAMIRAMGLADTADVDGWFEILVPIAQQREEYELRIVAEGFAPAVVPYHPATGDSFFRLQPSQ